MSITLLKHSLFDPSQYDIFHLLSAEFLAIVNIAGLELPGLLT